MATRNFTGLGSAGAHGQLWSDPLNWDTGVPLAGDIAVFDTFFGSGDCEVDVATPALGGLDSTNGSGDTLTLTQNLNVTGATADAVLSFKLAGSADFSWTRNLSVTSGTLLGHTGRFIHLGTGAIDGVYSTTSRAIFDLVCAAAGQTTKTNVLVDCKRLTLGTGSLNLDSGGLAIIGTRGGAYFTGAGATIFGAGPTLSIQPAANGTCGGLTTSTSVTFSPSAGVTLTLTGDVISADSVTFQSLTAGTGTVAANGNRIDGAWLFGTSGQATRFGKLILGTANHLVASVARQPTTGVGIMDFTGSNFTLSGTMDLTGITAIASAFGAVHGGTIIATDLTGQSHLHAYTSTDGGSNVNVDFSPISGVGTIIGNDIIEGDV